MGIKTPIEWCDSTSNEHEGCSGCELWRPKVGVRRCYAGNLTERFRGRSFSELRFFPSRIGAALRWPDLTGTTRPDKPWLDGHPRLIFWDDMSDALDRETFRDGVEGHWLVRYREEMADSRHQHLILTKRATALAKLPADWPENFWLGTSITGAASRKRAEVLAGIETRGMRFLSVEPMDEYVDLRDLLPRFHWVICGGGSGADEPPLDLDAARRLRDDCDAAGVAFFFKQLGTALSPSRGKGGLKEEIPSDLWRRGMPAPKDQRGQVELFGVGYQTPQRSRAS